MQVTGIVDATDVETTAHDEGCGQVTHTQKSTDTRGQVQEIAVTVYGWKLMVLIDARTTIPLAAKVVPMQAHETLFLRALVTQARTNLATAYRLPCEQADVGGEPSAGRAGAANSWKRPGTMSSSVLGITLASFIWPSMHSC